MREEIYKLLEKEGIISEELNNINIHDFYNNIKEMGLKYNSETMKKEKISEILNTKFVGKDIYIYNEVSSTNTLGKFFAVNKTNSGSVIIAEKQTRAKGRNGKVWQSPNGGIGLSVVLNPFLKLSKAPLITLATGVAVCKTLEKLGIEDVKIKWPNDILIHGKKVSGILTESMAKLNAIEYIVVGVGINVNIKEEELPEPNSYNATSLYIEKGEELDVNEVIKTFLEEFEDVCELFMEKNYEQILNSWRKRSYTIGKVVKVQQPFGRSYEGYVVGIDKEGTLIIEKADGTLQKVISGEVSIR